MLDANYGGAGKSWREGDFNGDGIVNVGDLGILGANFGSTSTPIPPGGAVPEPATLLLMGAALPVLLKRRRSRS